MSRYRNRLEPPPGGAIKISVWIASRDRHTWIVLAEVVVLGLVLFTPPDTMITLFVGLPLLAHLGYRALTSLPAGQIPGRPNSKAQKRRNYQLRAHVGAFLNEVKRMESYVQSARSGGVPRSEVKQQLRTAEKRLLDQASQVARATGKIGV